MPNESDDWSVWVEQHGSSLILLAQQFVRCRSDAEDIVHEAFLTFWRSRNKAQDRTAYLYTCVRNASVNWLRSRKRQTARELAQARPETDNWFVQDSDQGERQKEVKEILAALSTEQSEVLVMKIWGGLTFPQIAQALGISPNTAASRYRYALEKLRAGMTMESMP